MKINLKGKGLIKTIALALAGVAAIGVLAFGVKAIVDYTKNDLKTISPSFEVGNLGNDGKFVDDESTLYTKEAFACYGLQIKPDFDSTVNYQIFYYDILDNYISATEIMSDGFSGEAPLNGAYARLVIEPRDDEDGKISLTERIKYPSQLTVKVRKEQNINERFGSFKGKMLQVVSDTESLVFTNKLTFVSTSMTWEVNDLHCVTSTTALKVTGGSTLKYDCSSLGESYSKSCIRLYQFKDLPLDDNIISTNFGVVTSSTTVLEKQTKYILICVDTAQSGVEWTETELAKLPSCFSIIKTN